MDRQTEKRIKHKQTNRDTRHIVIPLAPFFGTARQQPWNDFAPLRLGIIESVRAIRMHDRPKESMYTHNVVHVKTESNSRKESERERERES